MSDPGGQTVTTIWAVAVATALVASLLARRVPMGTVVRNAAIWVLIFAGIYGIALFRGELGEAWRRAREDVTGAPEARADGRAMLVRADDAGQFFVTADVGGGRATFLIDTGASVSVVERAHADRLGLKPDPTRLPETLMTANGPIGVRVARPVRIVVGSIATDDMPLRISGNTDGTNVLGTDWLARLRSWRVEGRTLRLEP